MSDQMLAEQVRALRGEIAFPEGSGFEEKVVAAVMARRLRMAPPRLRVAAAALAALAVAASATLALSPRARRAVADWLGIGGVRVELKEPAISPAPSPDLAFGRSVTVAQAGEMARFELLAPSGAFLDPDAAYFSDLIPGGQVTFVYGPSPSMPESPKTGIGLLVTQFEGTPDPGIIRKTAGSGTKVESFLIDGNDALWIHGRPHVFYYVDGSGRRREETVRLAGDVLLVDADGITLRLEGSLSRSRMVQIALTFLVGSR